MTTADDNYEDEYSDYDAYDDEDDEGGLSGFAVLMIGLVMFGAFAATTYVFYQKGIKQGELRAGVETPYVAADPEPIKIETAETGEPVEDREVYDVFDGDEPEPVTVIAEGPEEPVDRNPEDAIGALAAEVAGAAEEFSEDAQERVASLAEEDAEYLDPVSDPEPEPIAATSPTPVNATPSEPAPTPAAPSQAPSGSSDPLSGSHVVQVGAFRSQEEALAQWSRMQSRIGEIIGDKTHDIERADLGDRGVYHRLRLGPFPDSDAAKTYCAALKENGQDCLIKKI